MGLIGLKGFEKSENDRISFKSKHLLNRYHKELFSIHVWFTFTKKLLRKKHFIKYAALIQILEAAKCQA